MPVSRLPDNLPAILRAAGLTVVEHEGWRHRDVSGSFAAVGVLCHHTATGRNWRDEDVVRLLIRGRSNLAGPLSQLGLDRQGRVHLIAAGRANHGGDAKPSGTVAGGNANTLYIGIEAFNDGVGEKWPAVQYDAYVLLAATLCRKVTGNSANTVRGHKETSVTGKIDPTFDMDKFRNRVMWALKPPPPKGPQTRGPAVDHALEDTRDAIKHATGERRSILRRAADLLRSLPRRAK